MSGEVELPAGYDPLEGEGDGGPHEARLLQQRQPAPKDSVTEREARRDRLQAAWNLCPSLPAIIFTEREAETLLLAFANAERAARLWPLDWDAVLDRAVARGRAEGAEAMQEAAAKVAREYPTSASKPIGQSIAKRIRAMPRPAAPTNGDA